MPYVPSITRVQSRNAQKEARTRNESAKKRGGSTLDGRKLSRGPRRVDATANSSVGYRWGPGEGKLVGALVGSSVSGAGQRSGRTPASRAIPGASLRSRVEEDIPEKRRRRRRRRGDDASLKRGKIVLFFHPREVWRPSYTQGKCIPFFLSREVRQVRSVGDRRRRTTNRNGEEAAASSSWLYQLPRLKAQREYTAGESLSRRSERGRAFSFFFPLSLFSSSRPRCGRRVALTRVPWFFERARKSSSIYDTN